ncbi:MULTISPECIES: FkbM family methyltransferase [unclassified Mesorhizobium]|uniref:FkbM family methyltransferase n=1 Tax=unclassified Mesorhizobium TaxID=325217 RepID=UPI000FD62199|nr:MULTISPECIES: FkbM family methyltransferase [unclassified Mesorhizobium]RVB80574.1 FkbM family methyltransferase [Mesorhizobium sp. M6A.T.Cr.TU.014.01.1.1]RWP97567.1 MAG: FkbM family methyltransferase [Mesorhizobium sp.]RWQ10840.1 MAG: FkbM family methyltransferase [Mesorhizobium sp.]
MGQLQTALNLLAAPAAFILGRMAGSPARSARSIDFDPQYLRGYASRMQDNNINSEMFIRFAQGAKLCASANKSIDDSIVELFPKSHGQLLQDIVCSIVHRQKRCGYFVEVGVGDGEKYSNTLMLERDFGWHGVLAEPATMFHDSIRKLRSAVLDARAIGQTNGRMLFEQDEKIGELSGLVGKSKVRENSSNSRYDVDVINFDEFLEEHRAPDEIDYISIDTEGSELSVINGLSLKNRRIWFFTVEHNFDKGRIRAYEEIFSKFGYRRILPSVSAFDSWYVHRELGDEFF